MMKEDPLAVERVELLGMIEQLERLNADLGDSKAGESAARLKKLHRLRGQLNSTRSRSKRKLVWTIAMKLLSELGAELIRRLTDSSNYLMTAFKTAEMFI